MSEGDSSKPGVSSALLSIASAYSDSESSEEVGDDSGKITVRTFGGLVEDLRAQAKEDSEKTTSEEAVAVEGQFASKFKIEESEKKQPLIKIVRLDSGKVVKLSTSPNKVDSHSNEEVKREDKEGKSEGNKITGFQSSCEPKKLEEHSEKSRLDSNDSKISVLSSDVIVEDTQSTKNDVAEENVKPNSNVNVPLYPFGALEKSSQLSTCDSSLTSVKELNEPVSCDTEPKTGFPEKTEEKITKKAEESVDQGSQAEKSKTELIETDIEDQKNTINEIKDVEEKDTENTEKVQAEEPIEKEISASSSKDDSETSINLKADKDFPNIPTIPQASVTSTKCDEKKCEGIESKETVEATYKSTKSSSIDDPDNVVESTVKTASASEVGKKEDPSNQKPDDDEVQIEREILKGDKISAVSRPFAKTENILKKALSSEGRSFPKMEEISSWSLLRKDLDSPAITANESEDDIEIISSTVKTDSQQKKIILVRDDKKGRSTERKPLPALERIHVKPNVAKIPETGIKRVEPIKIQTSPGEKTKDQSGTSAISPTGMRKISGTGPGPIKLKRNFGEASNPDQATKKMLVEPTISPPDPKSAGKPKSQFSSSEEIREILAKRLGTSLDISIVPSKPKEPSVTIGEVEIIAQSQQSPPLRQDNLKSPPRVQIPHMQIPSLHSPGSSRPQLSPSFEQKVAMSQNYQASFANMINSAHNRLPVQPQHHLQKTSPPQGKPVQPVHQSQQHLQHSQQHNLLSPTSQQSKMLGKDIMTSQFVERPTGAEQRRTVPLIIRRNDLTRKQEKKEEKVMPIKLSLREEGGAGIIAKKLPGQSEISTDSSTSSGSEVPSSTVQSSASSQENPNFGDGNIDFENMIGSSVVCKDTGLSPPPQNFDPNIASITSQPAAYDPSQIQQPTVTLEPIPPEIIPVVPTPRKRGRPRKIQQQVLNSPNPVVSAWPAGAEGNEEKGGRLLGRAERRKRREANKTVFTKKKEETTAAAEDSKGEDEGGDDETPKKKRFIPRSPKSQLKKKRRRGVYSAKKKPQTPRKFNAEKENVQNFEEETRMSASEVGSTPSRAVTIGDESQSSVNTEGQASRTVSKKGRMEVVAESKPITVQQIVEYYWPPVGQLKPGEKPEGLMIQEQISEYLGVKSFKRKYPSIKRRAVEMEERNYLQENGYVSESMCDMGLTAVYSSDIIEIMYNDFPQKFEEFRKFAREKKAKEQKALREKQAAERADIDPKKEAIESAMSWNNEFNKTRRIQGFQVKKKSGMHLIKVSYSDTKSKLK